MNHHSGVSRQLALGPPSTQGAIREQDFWLKEVTTLATLLLARSKGGSRGDDSSDSPRRASGTKKKAKRKFTGEDKSVWDAPQNAFTVNRKGIEICQKFSANRCGNGKPQGRCPAGRSHQCNRCQGLLKPGEEEKGRLTQGAQAEPWVPKTRGARWPASTQKIQSVRGGE